MEIIMKLKEIKTNTEHYFQDENGFKQGECKEYYDNGQLWVHCFYKNNKKQGEYKVYHIDGSLAFIDCYKNDIRHGEFKVYNPDGSLGTTKYFSNGKNITNMYFKLQTWKSL